MKPLFPYYGGKQWAVPTLLDLLPKHFKKYVEPFFGAGALFWALPEDDKRPYVVNDHNHKLIAFYEVLQNPAEYDQLLPLIAGTLHCEHQHDRAKKIYHEDWENENMVKRAWAVWMLLQTSIGGQTDSSFQKETKEHRAGGKFQSQLKGQKKAIVKQKEQIIKRLEKTIILCQDAISVIDMVDNEDVLIFQDPPYVGADQGHYKGYREENLIELLETDAKLKGMFLLTHQEHPILDEYIQKYGWNSKKIEKLSFAGPTKTKKRTECFCWNYDEKLRQRRLF